MKTWFGLVTILMYAGEALAQQEPPQFTYDKRILSWDLSNSNENGTVESAKNIKIVTSATGAKITFESGQTYDLDHTGSAAIDGHSVTHIWREKKQENAPAVILDQEGEGDQAVYRWVATCPALILVHIKKPDLIYPRVSRFVQIATLEQRTVLMNGNPVDAGPHGAQHIDNPWGDNVYYPEKYPRLAVTEKNLVPYYRPWERVAQADGSIISFMFDTPGYPWNSVDALPAKALELRHRTEFDAWTTYTTPNPGNNIVPLVPGYWHWGSRSDLILTATNYPNPPTVTINEIKRNSVAVEDKPFAAVPLDIFPKSKKDPTLDPKLDAAKLYAQQVFGLFDHYYQRKDISAKFWVQSQRQWIPNQWNDLIKRNP